MRVVNEILTDISVFSNFSQRDYHYSTNTKFTVRRTNTYTHNIHVIVRPRKEVTKPFEGPEGRQLAEAREISDRGGAEVTNLSD